ncbi:hypothetical protein, partial [Shewanella algidipiscicola]
TLPAGQAIDNSEDTNFKDTLPTLIQPNVKPQKCQHLHSKSHNLLSKNNLTFNGSVDTNYG